ncbi:MULTISPECIES: TetR/AcrR family transcriptional regulator [Desulfobacula]|nr:MULTISPECIES: TetR/AcrR family transcriptional regulator [Desulfobacula]SDU51387.1 transcriptional regulator, TetR family [Desulfobacula phenolica]
MKKEKVLKKKVKRKTGKQSSSDTRMQIIEAAKKLFADKGFHQTTVVDISKSIGLSEAALYEYFKGKEDLLLEIPDLWISELLEDLENHLFGIKGAENKLRKYLWWYLRRIELSPLDAKVVYLNLKTNAKFLKTDVYLNVKTLYYYPVSIISEGIKNGELRADLDPQAARDIFISTMDHLVTCWLLNDMSYPLFENIETIFSIIVNGFRCE